MLPSRALGGTCQQDKGSHKKRRTASSTTEVSLLQPRAWTLWITQGPSLALRLDTNSPTASTSPAASDNWKEAKALDTSCTKTQAPLYCLELSSKHDKSKTSPSKSSTRKLSGSQSPLSRFHGSFSRSRWNAGTGALPTKSAASLGPALVPRSASLQGIPRKVELVAYCELQDYESDISTTVYYRFRLEPDRICEAEVRMKSGKLHLAKENGSPKKWFRLIHIFVGGSYDMYTCFTCPNRTGIHPGPRIIGFGLPANKHKSQYQFQMLLQFA